MKAIKFFKPAACILILLFFTGCGPSKSMFKKPEAGANYGPKPIHYKETIEEYFEDRFYDPDSARYKYGELTRAYKNRGALWGGDVKWMGWAVDVKINAKNRLGGYTGYKKHLFLFNGENIHKINPLVTDKTFHRVY